MKILTKLALNIGAVLALQSCQASSTETQSKKSGAESEDQKTGGTSTSPIVTSTLPDEETVSVPSIVSGALLVCFNENESEKSTLVSCGAVGKSDGKKLDLQSQYKDPSFTVNNTAALKVEKEALPTNSKWHVRFRLSGNNRDELSNALKKVSFNFEAKNQSGVIVSQLEQTIVEYPKKLSFRIRNLQAANDGRSMCLNSHYEAGYPDIVTLEPCDGKAAQDWNLNQQEMIEWGMGSCLNIDKIEILHPRGCALPEAAQWLKNGDEIRLKNSNKCLAMSDKYLLFGNVFPLDCNASDPMQRWAIEAL